MYIVVIYNPSERTILPTLIVCKLVIVRNIAEILLIYETSITHYADTLLTFESCITLCAYMLLTFEARSTHFVEILPTIKVLNKQAIKSINMYMYILLINQKH